MSIIENLTKGRDAPKSHAPAAPDIRKKLDGLQSKLSSMQSQLAEMAFEAHQGSAEAARKFITTKEQIEQIKAEVSQLNLALKVALERDHAEVLRQRASLHKGQLAKVRKDLDARDAAARAMETALAQAAEQYKIVIERSRAASLANPIGGEWPAGSISELHEIKPLLAAQLYKLMPGDVMGRLSPFPGADCDLDYRGLPDKIKTLADALSENSRYIMTTLTGKAD